MRDSIDFKNMDIAALFRKLLLPTVLGMIFSALFVITDGIFVGKGIGSDALAAVNIVAPLWLFSTGIGLMFGVGASVVASIHLSHNKPKTARINITQTIVVTYHYANHSGNLPAADVHFYPILPVCTASGTSVRQFGTAQTFGCRIYVLVCTFFRFYGPA